MTRRELLHRLCPHAAQLSPADLDALEAAMAPRLDASLAVVKAVRAACAAGLHPNHAVVAACVAAEEVQYGRTVEPVVVGVSGRV